MTDNHLLLYRLAELMLINEQQQLSVDLLFDDSLIGDFVKSIQIDSPYQQMLLEGVLTESIRDEKVFVGFTVEGYFHFVLGEVIYNQTEGKGAEVLKQLVEENKLNGIKEGGEQCLIRDVNRDDLSRLMWLIEESGKLISICFKPLALALLFKMVTNIKKKGLTFDIQNQVDLIIIPLIKNQSNSSIRVLTKSISFLKKKNENNLIKYIYEQVATIITLKTIDDSLLLLDSIPFLSKSQAELTLYKVSIFSVENEKKSILGYYYAKIAAINMKNPIRNYDRAIEYFKRAVDINENYYSKTHLTVAINYHEIALCWFKKGNYEKSLEYHLLGQKIELKNSINALKSTYESLGLSYLKLKNYYEAIDYFNKALEINLKKFGQYHTETGYTFICLALANYDNNNLESAKHYFKEAHLIFLKNMGKNHKQTIQIKSRLDQIK